MRFLIILLKPVRFLIILLKPVRFLIILLKPARFHQNCSITADTYRKGHKQRAPVSLTASYTSTIAEEIVTLLRTLHESECWTTHINKYITDQLLTVTDLMVPNVKPAQVGKMFTLLRSQLLKSIIEPVHNLKTVSFQNLSNETYAKLFNLGHYF